MLKIVGVTFMATRCYVWCHASTSSITPKSVYYSQLMFIESTWLKNVSKKCVFLNMFVWYVDAIGLFRPWR